MKVLALDYGSARTGVAVSDPTGTLARPVATVASVDETSGFDELVALVNNEEPELVGPTDERSFERVGPVPAAHLRNHAECQPRQHGRRC